MELLPKFLREFPNNTSSVVEEDIMPISRGDGDDSYKITTQKLRDDVLGQPLVGIRKPYIYGDSHYTVAAGTIVKDIFHGPNALTCSSSTDFDAIQPGHLLKIEDLETNSFLYRTVIKKNYSEGFLTVESGVETIASPTPFEYSDPRLALLSTTNDMWRPVANEGILKGLIDEHITYFDYEPIKANHILVSNLSTHIQLTKNSWTLVKFDNVEWNNFGEWNQTGGFFTPTHSGLYRFDIIFTLDIRQFNPGDNCYLVLAPYGNPGGLPKLGSTTTYPSMIMGYISVNLSSMAVMTENETYAWYAFNNADEVYIDHDSVFPPIISIKRERSLIGRT